MEATLTTECFPGRVHACKRWSRARNGDVHHRGGPPSSPTHRRHAPLAFVCGSLAACCRKIRGAEPRMGCFQAACEVPAIKSGHSTPLPEGSPGRKPTSGRRRSIRVVKGYRQLQPLTTDCPHLALSFQIERVADAAGWCLESALECLGYRPDTPSAIHPPVSTRPTAAARGTMYRLHQAREKGGGAYILLLNAPPFSSSCRPPSPPPPQTIPPTWYPSLIVPDGTHLRSSSDRWASCKQDTTPSLPALPALPCPRPTYQP
ncbi:hypothetical protein QBC47DRAFT_79182 [Echria macrotheca]|uniref:Uncharacterized protein n=1 Tax=Echria macrotheca TaxID=438768 RepID=A0AAJ0B573_9PEZI|nr:hypothetical protein QBC47DRAFT_79182 [Echria macrotheca]